MDKRLPKDQIKQSVDQLRSGDERGLNYFYKRYFRLMQYRAFCRTKDESIAESIAQEAFFRLWLFRTQIESQEDVLAFLRQQVHASVEDFYSRTLNRFHRNLLRLDGIEGFQEFMLGIEDDSAEDDSEENSLQLDALEEENQEKLKKLNQVLPQLQEEQQLFIRLCLKYSFNYERIAYHLGGISDYEVSLRVEGAINALKTIFESSEKLEKINKPGKIRMEGSLDALQGEVFHLRYELQYSFDEIASALKLSSIQVRKLFVEAHLQLKNQKLNKKIA